jgi:hypothetical protein
MPEPKTLSPSQLNDDALCAPVITPASPLKPPEFTRDRMGRFERTGATLKKVQKTGHRFKKGQAPGPGRPKGSQGKITVALKEAILAAGEAAGGAEGLTGYLTMLARDNSSAYAGLLAKILPHTLAPASVSDGGGKITFERIVCWPDGRREVEGVTPKSLPPPDASNALPNSSDPIAGPV